MVIETERLLLREMTDEDFDALYKVLADPNEITKVFAITREEWADL